MKLRIINIARIFLQIIMGVAYLGIGFSFWAVDHLAGDSIVTWSWVIAFLGCIIAFVSFTYMFLSRIRRRFE